VDRRGLDGGADRDTAPTRWIASVVTVAFGSDLFQISYKKAERAL
jgi:hypothetical protein